ncbi:glycoside hydrolase family 88 protein [Marinimicrobium locisalis]|uniref:glycoside hydrolase family 88 protein n=1 Tax=Marinimicrobium locisalis TaxID=546022 RepID=UPI00322156B9
MRPIAHALWLGTLSLLLGCQHTPESQPHEITPESVKTLTKQVADWQIEHFEEQGKYRALPQDPPDWANREQYHDLEWHNGALYAGMNQWRQIAEDPKYTQWLMMIGERNDWALHKRPYHADDHTVGQFYLALYEDFNDPEMLEPVREQFNWILDNPKTGTLVWDAEDTHAHDRWGWSDALFMAPPVWARLAKVTGEDKYLEFMHQEYMATYELLWSEEDHLFFRDSSFFEQREKNDENIYWSRGNGWVFGGLALMIPDLPPTWEERDFYLKLYKKMARKLKAIQRDDGTWSMGLLGGVAGYPIKETSGTSSFTFGLAWGINQGILDRETYEPVVRRAWQALADAVTEEGLLGHVQPVGAAPGDSFPDYTEVYGVGAFLAAGSELYKMFQAEQSDDKTASAPAIRTFMYNGGWCWFQDPRAIIHKGQLIVGGVAGNGAGDAAVGVYDLGSDARQGRTTLHKHFDHDDHNTPAFYPREDDTLLAVYARHSTENKHYYRFSEQNSYLEWGEEHTIEAEEPVTYMNLVHLDTENTLYNFYRGIDWNPTLVTSKDEGKTWGDAQHFIQNEVEGRHRPYARYASNGQDTVGVSFTDAHPRDYGTSLYYTEFRNGNFYNADGTFIKNLEEDGPLRPSEAEKVFQGGEGGFRSMDLSAEYSAWTSSIVLDEHGHPHIGYSLYLSNNDQRYRIASWDGEKWIDREVAHAGTRLYEREASYTGLITLNPEDPTEVAISTDVNPATGEALNGKHQIFRAIIGPEDETSNAEWQQVTHDPARHNIRPMFVPGEEHDALVWLRGQYNTYTDYYMDAVGLIE